MLKPLVLATAIGFCATSATADTIADGDFTNRAFDATGTATVSQEATGGSPGGRLNVTTISGPLVYGTAVLTNFDTFHALQGETFHFSVDAVGGPGSYGDGQAIQLLAEQNGSIYGNFLGTTGSNAAWRTFSATVTFKETAFTRLIGAGPVNRDFDGGIHTCFGFAAGNSGSGTLTQHYDNFSLASPAIEPVPEPETYALMLSGPGLVGFAAQRRKEYFFI